jgi:SAM-dependent methyltransferase
LCNSSFCNFEPFGAVKRENARCHTCNSLERHRLLWTYFKDKTNLFKNIKKIKLLHFAPEECFYNIFSKDKNIEYYPGDLMPHIYNYYGPVKIQKMDVTSIPFEDNYFDVIICNHVLEHIENDSLAMSELYRVMKKGSWGAFMVPIDQKKSTTYEDFSIMTPEARLVAFGQDDHVRIYGRDYVERLGKHGFNVLEENYCQLFSDEDCFRFGFLRNELIHICRK